jgi:hypothetical protein
MRKIQSVISLLFLLLLLAAVGAAQKGKKTPKVASDFFPLSAGDTWKYRHSEGAEFTIKVLDVEKQADGTTRYKVESQSGNQVLYWYSKTAGWVLLHDKVYPDQEGLKAKYDPPKQHLKNPLVKGETWVWTGMSEVNQQASESYKVIGPETVKVLAGTFRTMKIVGEISDGEATKTRTDWYAEGVGLVKSMTEGRGLKYGWELEDYSFKKVGPKK